jgi:ABC-type transport system substrate-binding protein
MNIIDKIAAVATGGRSKPGGKIFVVDTSPINWLYITYNTVEELVRVNHDGAIEPAAISTYHWVDDHTLEVRIREEEVFPDGEPLNAESVKRSFDEQMRWAAPHPPGTHFNPHSQTRCVITGDRTVRFLLPEPDGLMLGKLRATHIMSTRFWNEIGFGYARNGTGEGHW